MRLQNEFEILEIIPCLNARETIAFARFRHKFGDGFRKNLLYGSETGTKKWSLTYRTLANVGEETYDVNGLDLSPAEYLWDFYCRKQISGEPFVIISPRNGQYYLCEFSDDELTEEKIAVQLFTTGVQFNQVRENNDFVFSPYKFGNVLEYKADTLDLADESSIVNWTESNEGPFLSISGGVTFHTDEQNGLPIIRLNGTDAYLSLSGTHKIYHAFFVIKITESTFGGNDGLLGDDDLSLINGVSGEETFGGGEPAPMQEYGIVWITFENGVFLKDLQIGKNQAIAGTFLKADIGHIVLSKEQKPATDLLEMVEYLATKWGAWQKFNLNSLIFPDVEPPSIPEAFDLAVSGLDFTASWDENTNPDYEIVEYILELSYA